jgi:hypothetical protein
MTNDFSVWFFELEESLRKGRKMKFSIVDGLKIEEETYKRNRGKHTVSSEETSVKMSTSLKNNNALKG